MRYWFQNLNDNPNNKKLFYFRGSVGSDFNDWFRYELCSGFSFRLGIQDSEGAIGISIGFLFFTIYLTLYKVGTPKFLKDKYCNIYWYECAIWWHFLAKKWESSSSDPWWMSGSFHVDDFFLGKSELIRDRWISVENIEFKMGENLFNMDSIKWEKWRRFRRHIPYSLYHKDAIHVEMNIKKPPLYSGKGENSWDCGDDGTYGLSMDWKYLKPTWENKNECARLAIDYYVESVLKNAKRYGGSSSDRGINKNSIYKFIGIKPYTVESCADSLV